MKEQILQFNLNQSIVNTINMSKYATILSVSANNNYPVLFVLVYISETDFEDRHFKIYNNDDIVESDRTSTQKYIGSYYLFGIYYHVFEIKEININ